MKPYYIEAEMGSFWPKFQSLAAPEIVNMTTSNKASKENFIKMTLFPFHC